MALDLNPHAPGTLGLEYTPTVNGSASVDVDSRAVAVRVDSTATETVETIVPYVDTIAGGDGPVLVEVYEFGNEQIGDITTSVFRPNSTIENENSDWWKNGWVNRGTWSVNRVYATDDVVTFSGVKYKAIAASGPTATTPPSNPTKWTAISAITMQGPVQEATLDLSDFDTYKGSAKAYSDLTFGFNTSAWVGGGACRILDVRLCFVASTQEDEFVLKPIYTDGVSPFGKYQGVIVGTDVETFSVSFGQMHPSGLTSRPWTDDDIDALDTGEGFGFRPYGGKSKGLRIYQVWIEVDWTTENRVAYGTLNRGPGPTWPPGGPAPIPVVTPAGATGWPKVNGTSYSVLFRRVPITTAQPLSYTVRYFDSGGPAPQTSYLPTLSGGVVSTIGQPTTHAVPLILELASGWSADSFVYSTFDAAPVNADAGAAAQLIYSTTGDTDYRLVRAAVRYVAGDDPLEVAVFRASDNVQMSGTLLVSPAELAAYDDLLGEGWKFLDDFIPGLASLAGSTYYYVRFVCAAAAGEGFEVAFLQCDIAETLTYGGTNAFLYSDGAADDTRDALVTFATAPAPPPMFAADVAQQDVGDDGTGCPIETVDYALVTWEPTALGDAFAGYQIQRSDSVDEEWRDVALLSTEEVWQFRDSDARFATTTRYQMRVLRDDGSRSPWTLYDAVDLTPPSCGLAISSNVRPDLMVAYQDIGARTYKLADADETTFKTRYAQGYQTVGYPLEAGSDVLPLSLIIYAESDTGSGVEPVDGPGRRVFDPLLRIAGQTVPGEEKVILPYVCLRNEAGDRWFGTLVVSACEWDGETNRYIAQCSFTETTDSPAVVDVEATGALILGSAAAWWDARSITDETATTVQNIGRGSAGPLTFLAGISVDGRPALSSRPFVHDGPTVLMMPGWDDMWLETADLGEYVGALDLRIDVDGTRFYNMNPDSSPNWLIHQGTDGTGSFGLAQDPDNGELSFWWTEDGSTWNTEVIGTPTFGTGPGRLALGVAFDVGGVSIVAGWEQSADSPPAAMDAPVSDPLWTQIGDLILGAPTSIFDSGEPIRISSTTDPDFIDGQQTTGNGTYRRITIRDEAGTVLADIDLSTVTVEELVWSTQTGLPPVGPVTTASYTNIIGRAGETWTLYNYDTPSTPAIFVDRNEILLGSQSGLEAPISGELDFDETDSFAFLTAYRGTRVDLSATMLSKTEGSSLLDVGYLLTADGSGGIVAVVADGSAVAISTASTTLDKGRTTVSAGSVDRAGDLIRTYTNGQAGPDASPLPGSPSDPALHVTWGKASDYVQGITSLEWFFAAIFGRPLTDAEAVLIYEYAADPTQTPANSYRPFLP